MSDMNFGTQGRICICFGVCKKVSVYKLQRDEYLMRRHDFGKNFSPARVMEEDTSHDFSCQTAKNGISAQSSLVPRLSVWAGYVGRKYRAWYALQALVPDFEKRGRIIERHRPHPAFIVSCINANNVGRIFGIQPCSVKLLHLLALAACAGKHDQK